MLYARLADRSKLLQGKAGASSRTPQRLRRTPATISYREESFS